MLIPVTVKPKRLIAIGQANIGHIATILLHSQRFLPLSSSSPHADKIPGKLFP
jgi:hypothetical protein